MRTFSKRRSADRLLRLIWNTDSKLECPMLSGPFCIQRKFFSEASPCRTSKLKEQIFTAQIEQPFLLHNIPEKLPTESHTNKEELLQMYRDMLTIRRMEMSADIVCLLHQCLQSFL
ncbi:hypothetical protein KP509_28G006600 [Ceratopteris richardii]|uniref:Uncharacterized protein n=1 Tax=Ceratopteris richardii TaxID=49495 RepID=A0A8T2RAT8_CERRI|nr:hypothetical protein KP509_28G006600 [Ceratopteris richardii]